MNTAVKCREWPSGTSLAHLLYTPVHPPRNELSSFLGGCKRVPRGVQVASVLLLCCGNKAKLCLGLLFTRLQDFISTLIIGILSFKTTIFCATSLARYS